VAGDGALSTTSGLTGTAAAIPATPQRPIGDMSG
jgi:hypothetical protein